VKLASNKISGHQQNWEYEDDHWKGPVCYIDTVGSVICPELNTVSTRAINPFKIEPEVARRLNREVFPYWMKRSIQEIARYTEYDTDDYPNRDEVDGTSQEPPLRKKAGETPRSNYTNAWRFTLPLLLPVSLTPCLILIVW
jgi:hypothetical protein